MCAAALNREGTSIALSVFDPNGQFIASKQSGLIEFDKGTALALSVFDQNGQLIASRQSESDKSSAKAIYFDVPWGPVLTICKYLLENLQSPVFSIISYFTANSFEAGSGHSILWEDSFMQFC